MTLELPLPEWLPKLPGRSCCNCPAEESNRAVWTRLTYARSEIGETEGQVVTFRQSFCHPCAEAEAKVREHPLPEHPFGEV